MVCSAWDACAFVLGCNAQSKHARRSRGSGILQQLRALEDLFDAATSNSSRGGPVQRLLGDGVAQAELEDAEGRDSVCGDAVVVLQRGKGGGGCEERCTASALLEVRSSSTSPVPSAFTNVTSRASSFKYMFSVMTLPFRVISRYVPVPSSLVRVCQSSLVRAHFECQTGEETTCNSRTLTSVTGRNWSGCSTLIFKACHKNSSRKCDGTGSCTPSTPAAILGDVSER